MQEALADSMVVADFPAGPRDLATAAPSFSFPGSIIMKNAILPVLLVAAASLNLAGCAAWNKYDLRKTEVTIPSGASSIAVACVDERPSLHQGDITPELIGVTRNGYGIPYRVKTATKSPVAAEIADAVLRGFGSNRKLAPAITSPDAASALAALRGTGTERQVLIRIQKFNSDTLINTELDYSFLVEVRDSSGKLLSTSCKNETADLGGNFFLPAFHARKSVLSKTGTILSTLLAEPQMQAALN